MDRLQRFLAGAAVLALLSACGGGAPHVDPNAGAPNEREANLRMIMRLDGNHDGAVARTEFDQALHHDFVLVDKNGDGKLDAAETAAENDRRWQADGPAASPIFDWNQDGSVDYMEFANAAMGMFNLIDRDRDGQLSAAELQVLARAIPRPGGQGGRGGRGGRGPQRPADPPLRPNGGN